MAFTLYELIDPRTQEVRYVGYSKRPRQRLFAHYSTAGIRTRKASWIQSLKQDGQKPIMRALCVVESIDEVKRLEILRIAQRRSAGARLTNGTDGGDGCHGNRSRLGLKHRPETIEKMRAAAKGRRMSQEAREKMRASHVGKPLSVEHRQSLSAARRGKPLTEETRKRIGRVHAGKIVSAETREKIKEAARRQWADPEQKARHTAAMARPETRERMAAVRRGFVFSAESKAKMSASQKRRFARVVEP